jgi:hypothetical protein
MSSERLSTVTAFPLTVAPTNPPKPHQRVAKSGPSSRLHPPSRHLPGRSFGSNYSEDARFTQEADDESEEKRFDERMKYAF